MNTGRLRVLLLAPLIVAAAACSDDDEHLSVPPETAGETEHLIDEADLSDLTQLVSGSMVIAVGTIEASAPIHEELRTADGELSASMSLLTSESRNSYTRMVGS